MNELEDDEEYETKFQIVKNYNELIKVNKQAEK